MRSLKPIVRFLGGFVLLYGLLIVPWPGFPRAYGDYFRSLIRTVFTADSSDRRILRVEQTQDSPPPIDTKITLANREQIKPDGQGPAKILLLDSRGIGFIPMGLIVALTLATPVPWRRRLPALLAGLLLVHGLVLFSVGVFVWNQSADLDLLSLNPFWKWIAAGCEETFVTQLGASFVGPVLIWLVVSFRLQDVSTLLTSSFTPGDNRRRAARAP